MNADEKTPVSAGGEQDPSKILLTALRQYMHNDGSGLVAGYEYEETQRIVAAMAAEQQTLRDSWERMDEEWQAMKHDLGVARAELEAARKQEPVAIANKGDCAFWVSWTEAGKPLRGPGIKLYALPPLAGQVSGQEWVPVSERLPGIDEPSRVLVLTVNCGVMVASRGGPVGPDGELADCWTWDVINDISFAQHEVTHWMPIDYSKVRAIRALLATPSMEVKHGD